MIAVELMGGLGNQMFQYAIAKANSLKYNQELVLDLSFLLRRNQPKGFSYRDYELDPFQIQAETSSLIQKKDFCIIKERGSRESFKPKYINLYDNIPKDKNIYLTGFFQSLRYIKNIRDILLSDFSLKNELEGKALGILNEIKNSNSIGVQVRRTDSLVISKNHNRIFYGKEYINAGISIINKKIKKIKVFVFSDDIEWCKKNLTFCFPHVFVEDECKNLSIAQYNFLMSNCKHFIISNSTFAWWAAWLSQNKNKIVIIPEKKLVNTSHRFPDEWICI